VDPLVGKFCLYALNNLNNNVGKNGARVWSRASLYWTSGTITGMLHGWNTIWVFPFYWALLLHAATVILTRNGGELGIVNPKRDWQIS